jgi:hypothetical protein
LAFDAAACTAAAHATSVASAADHSDTCAALPQDYTETVVAITKSNARKA